MNTSILFGHQVRQIRTLNNLSQARLAEKAGLSSKYISDIELGKKRVSLDTADKIARALDLPLSTILKEHSVESADYIVALQEYKALIETAREAEALLSRLLLIFRELTGSKSFPVFPTRHPKN